jgi:hypothetical protein
MATATKRLIRTTRPAAVVAPTPAPARVIHTRTGRTAAVAPKTLWTFANTPPGKIRIAYTLALIGVQLGGILAGKTFRLWAAANVGGHIKKEELIKVDGKDHYRLTARGAAYFTEGVDVAGRENVTAMMKAVQTGNAPDFYAYSMFPMSPLPVQAVAAAK